MFQRNGKGVHLQRRRNRVKLPTLAPANQKARMAPTARLTNIRTLPTPTERVGRGAPCGNLLCSEHLDRENTGINLGDLFESNKVY